MTFREFLMHRKIGWLAIIGPMCALLSIWICIVVSPWFTWRNNAISDFGVHSVAPLFNSSLIACGIMCAIFALGVILRFKSKVGKIGMSVFFLACVSLVGIGVFHENLRPYHFIFSVAFFVLLLIATLILGPLFLLKRRTWQLGAGAIMVTVIGMFGWAYHVAVGWGTNVAIPEALTFVPGGIWFMMLGMWVLGKDSGKGKRESYEMDALPSIFVALMFGTRETGRGTRTEWLASYQPFNPSPNPASRNYNMQPDSRFP